jgi:hypothetical protein
MEFSFPSRLRWPRHSFNQLSFVSLARPRLRAAAALYFNEQSTIIIVARQGFSLVSFF